jgi:hypothetical protein
MVEEGSAESELPVAIKFVITNKAPAGTTFPEILFEEVRLNVGIPPDMHVETFKNLSGRESITYEHHCRYSEFAKMEFNIEGKVSPERLLQVRKPNRKIPTSKSPLSLTAYVEALKEMHIHRWLTDVIKIVKTPGPDTTLAEISSEQSKLSDAITEIRQAQHYFR